ncbi:threonylcarbamoyl-AMP synthase [Candidatus Collierbacteria bacterium CG10_big_fil_rev_8_21_14_0_10_44_9]|uniref:L-threonylcarbamoyladenylate synthase n=1 Tax=Candidatus Collierbacteria bacterium CG10_big_fil_rev_8_21_14_0_10_44_9 TaxID=1974535 RepID=A0A2H0VJB3_9BACT|nr:MAG: threonylcarbamoyl-AMP synthase [Candidatus Collierbacteria bacterium CG10_big_fil_rev_8_21_14_0_10_44_9]
MQITKACASLSRGELVIYPTETCYGIAADATNPSAVSRLLKYKGDRHRQVAIAVSDRFMAQKYVSLNEMASNLYQEFLPGPITVISNSLHKLDPRLESSTGTLGVRIPAYPIPLLLIKEFGRPITATSANTSGKKEPYSKDDWEKYTTPDKQKLVSLFLDAGKLADRPTSTVVDTTLNDPAILRQGELILPTLSHNFTTTSPATTQNFATELTHKYLPLTRRFPLILALQGELGVGKTQFVKGVATELGITLNISSPTYTLMREYPYPAGPGLAGPNNLPARPGPIGQSKYSGILYHLDTWRLSDPKELESTLHLKSLLKSGNIVAIEWAGKAAELLKAYEKDVPILVINIKEINVNTRQITYAFSTPEWS